jgi:beta-N-acetylhexosaminidase
MVNIHRFSICIALGLMALVAWAQESPNALTPITPGPSPGIFVPPAPTAEEEAPDQLEVILEKLDLEQRIAQLMVITPEGRSQPNTSDFGLMDQFPPGAILLRQILKPSDAFDYIAKLRGLERKTGIPLLIGADLYQLARRDRNAPSGFMQLPSLLALGAARHEESNLRVAGMMAEQMKAMGFDFYFGPSLALAPSVAGADGSVDTFGSDPAYAGEAGADVLGVMHETGLICVPTGFPGGELNHLPNSPSVLLTPPTVLAQEDVLPYRMAIDNGAKMIHVGPTLVPTLDPSQLPACLSPAVMARLLREQLKFEGVIVAGPMDTLNVTRVMDSTEAAVQALLAGADMIYWDEAGALVIKAIAAIGQAVREGRLSESDIEDRVRRIVSAKIAQRTGALAPMSEQGLEKLGGKKDYGKAAYDVERRALTLVQNQGYVLPLTEAGSMPIGITGTTDIELLRAALEKHIKPITMQRIGTAKHLGRIQDFEIHRITSHIRGWRTIVCVFTNDVEANGQADLIRELRSNGVRVVVVLLGYPQNLPTLAEADAIVLAYCDPATYDETMIAVADTLVGQGAISIVPAEATAIQYAGEKHVYNALELVRVPSGRLPVRLGEDFPAGLAYPYDPEPAIKKVEWDFGNGKRMKDPKVEFAYAKPGKYTLTLNVTDHQDVVTSQTFAVEVTTVSEASAPDR